MNEMFLLEIGTRNKLKESCYSVNDLFMNNRNPTEPCEMCGYAIHNMRLRNTVFVNTRFSRADA